MKLSNYIVTCGYITKLKYLLNKYIERIYYEIKMLKKVIQLLIIFAISILIGNMAYGMYREAQLDNGPTNAIENNKLENQTEENPAHIKVTRFLPN